MNRSLFLLPFLFCTGALAQQEENYSSLIQEAFAQYRAGDYRTSATIYTKAFSITNDAKPDDRYNAACSWALSNEADSAFSQLLKIARSGAYHSYEHITTDTDLQTLYNDARWEEVTSLVAANWKKFTEHWDQSLIVLLDRVYSEDIKYRSQEFEHGSDADRENNHRQLIADSINQVIICKILDERGWLGPDVISDRGSETLWLVIQHAPTEVQEKYMPMLREAVKKGNARAAGLAMLEDRVAMDHGNKQVYGSQILRNPVTGEFFIAPLADPQHVDQRRAEVGLTPLADYALIWNIQWDPAEYVNRLPEYEKWWRDMRRNKRKRNVAAVYRFLRFFLKIQLFLVKSPDLLAFYL